MERASNPESRRSKNVTFRIDPETYELIERMSAIKGESVSDFLRAAIDLRIDHLISDDGLATEIQDLHRQQLALLEELKELRSEH
jgi:uncharacterized protein (DUF1778 family)